MDKQLLEAKFRRMGARVRVSESNFINRVAIDVKRDRKGAEYFDLTVQPGASVWLDAIDVRPRQRHLLLMAADDADGSPAGAKQKFLCGHDERAWFVAAVPEARAASNVGEAMDALKPPVVFASMVQNGVRFRDRNRRRTDGFVRQGEWFFIPQPNAWVRDHEILKGEPLRRGNGKPHWAEFLARTGGEVVYTNRRDGRVLSWIAYERMVRDNSRLALGWTSQRRDMTVLVKGRIAHADHKTIVLPFWHQVVMNTENQSVAMRFVSFID